MKRRVIAIFLLAVFGALKMPVEMALDSAQKAALLRSTTLDLD